MPTHAWEHVWDGILCDFTQRGSFDFQTTVGSKTKAPSGGTINIKGIHCLDVFPTSVFFPYSAKSFPGKALKIYQSSSKFNI